MKWRGWLPEVMEKLKALILDGQVEPVASPYTHLMMGNVPGGGGTYLAKEPGYMGSVIRESARRLMESGMQLERTDSGHL